ncbi:hypothetical protein [Rhizobium bangladeshense]|uniref:hypothetical protein n=1 Tax=Rhizobium bangladeshense TaxID=1138189 RepID=UPI0007E53158|nr:hypothetical protein [Rhizobium bangladeshense]
MQVYLIVSQSPQQELGAAIARTYPNEYRQLAPDQWLVATRSTPQEVGEALSTHNARYGKVIIALVTQYWGWHEKETWNWIAMKAAAL